MWANQKAALGQYLSGRRDHCFWETFNLFYMDKANYAKWLKDPNDKSIEEHQLTTDGEEHYSYHRRADAEKPTSTKKRTRTRGNRPL